MVLCIAHHPRPKRAILAYETAGVLPRQNVKLKLAEALMVSVDYLDKDEIEDPTYGLEKTEYVEETRERFGSKTAKEIHRNAKRAPRLVKCEGLSPNCLSVHLSPTRDTTSLITPSSTNH